MALVLTRHPDEGITITIPPNTEETVLKIQARPKAGNQTSFAIHAPKQVLILCDKSTDLDKQGSTS